VNTFPLLGDDGLERAGVHSDEDGLDAVPETLPESGTLPPVRDAAQFEALRARAVRIAGERGAEPTILLACIGPLSAHVNTALWAKSFFETGGVTTLASGVQPDAAAQAALLAENGLTVAVLCPGRDAAPELQTELAEALRAAGARAIYLAGATPAAAAAVGADVGVRDGDDMVEVLGALLDHFEKSLA
jgi:methylmalonyl-CoA mutase